MLVDDPRHALVKTACPLQRDVVVKCGAQQPAGQNVIILVVFDEEHADRDHLGECYRPR